MGTEDETLDAFMSRARPTDVVERREALAAVERGLFGRAPGRPLTFGRFVLLDKLGSGGGGSVHAAYDPELDRKVAIKLVHPDRVEDAVAARQRLLREAQAIARLSHPNVLAIFDVGTFDESEARELPGVSRGGVYLVMELVDGPDLRSWLRETPRTVRQVLDVLVAVAEGIAAAHDQGIIHRDIKPTNILVGRDGRPRVLDFGLARKLREPSEPSSQPSPSTPALERSLTADGLVMGTPAYMAPEQHEARDTDERTDQYAFCVSLYEGLCGQRPFGGKRIEELARAKREGTITAPPPDRRVPRWLLEVVARGMAPDPDHRYPNMRALITELRDDPARKWGRRVALAAVLGLLGTSGILAYDARQHQQQVCDANGHLEGIWDASSRASVQKAFAASTLPYANRMWTHVETALDTWTGAWTDASEAACRAAMVEGSHSVADMSRATLCLERRLQRVGGTIGVLRQADDALVERAERIVQALPDLAPCRVGASGPEAPEATSPEQKRRLLETERRLAEASALETAGRYAKATELAHAALESARVAEDRLLAARALVLLGRIAQIEARVAESERLLRESILESERAEDELLTISTTLSLAFGVGIQGARPDEALHLVEQAEARLDKHGDLPRYRARIAFTRGRVLEARGSNEDAMQAFNAALPLFERAVGPDDPRTINTLNNLGVAHDRLGRYQEALRYYERALALRRRRYGEIHSETANALGNVGATYASLGRYADSIDPLRRSITIYTRIFGPDHRLVAWYRSNLGVALGRLRRHEEAIEEHRAALDVSARVLGRDHPRTGMAHTALSLGLSDLERGREALREADAAIAVLNAWPDRALLGDAHHARARALLTLGRSRDEVEPELRQALSLLEATRGEDHVETTTARLSLARAALQWGDHALARAQTEHAMSTLEAAQVAEPRRKPARRLLAQIQEASPDGQ